MDKDEYETVVIFRADRTRNPEITAVFPTEPGASAYDMTCYAHIGQHGSCAREWYNNGTRAAKPAEYAALKAELEGLGYQLKVYKRIQPWMREAKLMSWGRYK